METSEEILHFGGFRLDLGRGQLFCGENEVRLRPKAWNVLSYLARQAGRGVTVRELRDHCWEELSVSANSITNVIYSLRSTLAEHGGDAEWIRNDSRRGYRFMATVHAEAHDDTSSRPQASERHDSPQSLLVGRDKELAILTERWQQCLENRPQLVFVHGEPGIGKTSLIRRFVSTIEGSHQVCVGHCLPQQREAEPYMPVLEALGSLASLPSILSSALDEAPTWLIQMPWLLPKEARAPLRQSLAGFGPARMLREGKRLLALLAQEAPLLLVLEDVHWADTATTDLIRALAGESQGSRWLVVATYRSSDLMLREHPLREAAAELALKSSNVGNIALDSLWMEAVHEYLHRRFESPELATQIAPLLLLKSGGNPLFVETLTSYLCEQGRIVQGDGGWRLTVPVASLEIGLPDSVRDLVRAQLRQLDARDVRLLEAASAVGAEFNTLELEAALELEATQAEDACRRLARHRQFLRAVDDMEWPDGAKGESYRFSHATYREVILDDTASSRRRSLNARIAHRLIAAYGKRSREIAPRLAAHFEAAGDLEKEVEYLKLSVQLSAGRYAHHETLAYMDRTMDVLGRLPATEENALLKLGWQTERSNLIMAWRGYAAGYDAFDQLVASAKQQNNTYLELLGRVARTGSAVFGDSHRADLRAEADAILAIAAESHPELGFITHIVAGSVCDTTGDPAAGAVHAEAALAAMPEALSDLPRGCDQESFARTLLSGCLTRLGELERSRQERDLAILGAESRAGLDGQAPAFAFAACDALIAREPELAQSLAERTIHAAREGGFEHFGLVGEAAREAAVVAIATDDAIDPAGLDRLGALIETRRRLGENWYNMMFAGWLADGWRRRRDLGRAREVIDGAFASAEVVYVAELWRIKGAIEIDSAAAAPAKACAAGIAAASRCFETAIALSRQHGTRLFELRSTTSLARLHGGREASRAALAAICDSFPRALESVDLQEATAVLAQLAGNP